MHTFLLQAFKDESWKGAIDFTAVDRPPHGELKRCDKKWLERDLENGLLRQPDVFARLVGESASSGILTLKQVCKIDLFLRVECRVHLMEVKRPGDFGMAPRAAKQIIDHWKRWGHWLGRDCDVVQLWVLVAARWSESAKKAQVDEPLNLPEAGSLPVNVLYYTICEASSGSVMFVWRAGEAVPSLAP